MTVKTDILKILLSGTLENRKSSEITAFVSKSGDTLNQIQYSLFENLLRGVLGFSLVLAIHDTLSHGWAVSEIYRTAGFPGAVYALLCLLAIRLKWINRLALVRFQVALFLPLLTTGLATSAGLIDTGMMWLMSLPFLAQIYGGALFSAFLTAGTFISVGLLGALHFLPEVRALLPHFESSLLQSTLVAIAAVLIAGIHVFFQALKQRRLMIVESSLFHIRNTQSTVTTVREMAGAVAHQMNTPLSTYYLAIDQVRHQIPAEIAGDPEIDTILQRMETAVARITQVNRSLLMVTNHADLSSPTAIDLRKALNTAIEAFRNGSRLERPEITVIDNDFSEKVIAPDGALSQFLWRALSIVEDQLNLGPGNSADKRLRFQFEISDAGPSARLSLIAELIGKDFSSDIPTSLTLLGTHMLGITGNAHAELRGSSQIQVLLTFQKASTTTP